jgi:polar amino acid transport system substrate-binding protein
VEGIGVTMLISLSAAVGGSAFGFGLYMLSRSDKKSVRTITKCVAKVYSRIISGTPVVVILMILFYVVFGNVRDMSGILVAIIGFTLLFGAAVYSMLKTGVATVDYGQTEAAYSLGYTDTAAFYRIVLPQAMPFILSPLKGDMSALLKATAVVGYIAVQDLTKMADIVRSRTYDALFPLRSIAVIYFILEALINLSAKRVEPLFDPKRRKREDILKGVKRR